MVGTGGNTVPLGRNAPSFSRTGDMPSLLNPSYLQGANAAANAAAKRFNESASIMEGDVLFHESFLTGFLWAIFNLCFSHTL